MIFPFCATSAGAAAVLLLREQSKNINRLEQHLPCTVLVHFHLGPIWSLSGQTTMVQSVLVLCWPSSTCACDAGTVAPSAADVLQHKEHAAYQDFSFDQQQHM